VQLRPWRPSDEGSILLQRDTSGLGDVAPLAQSNSTIRLSVVEVRSAMSELLLAVLSEALGAALVALLIAAIGRLRGASA
jgi:hypothetical protein